MRKFIMGYLENEKDEKFKVLTENLSDEQFRARYPEFYPVYNTDFMEKYIMGFIKEEKEDTIYPIFEPITVEKFEENYVNCKPIYNLDFEDDEDYVEDYDEEFEYWN
jgi:hypothetical protein